MYGTKPFARTRQRTDDRTAEDTQNCLPIYPDLSLPPPKKKEQLYLTHYEYAIWIVRH